MKLGPRDRQIPFRHALNNVRFTSILLKNSNFGLDHNLQDRWQPQWKFP
jgi:hypothetical protein